MSLSQTLGRAETLSGSTPEAPVAAVSWGAIIGGAFVAVAMSLLLLALGSGIGLSSVSPFAGSGASATGFTIMAAIWLIVVQWVSAGFGGYLAGRLRTRWVGLHTHEVFFRDTAHGFLTWAVATVVVAVLVVSATTSALTGGVHAVEGAASGATQAVGQAAGSGYYVDTLFRSNQPAGNSGSGDNGAQDQAQAGRILAMAIGNGGNMPDGDKTYLAQMIANRTGLSQADATKRVDDVMGQEKAAAAKVQQAADAARKATASFSFFTFFSLLIGAFIACIAAAIGGQQRDEY